MWKGTQVLCPRVSGNTKAACHWVGDGLMIVQTERGGATPLRIDPTTAPESHNCGETKKQMPAFMLKLVSDTSFLE